LENEPLFVDTAFVYALFNSRDQWHDGAVEWQLKIAAENLPLITTQFVLTEIGNGLSSLKFRRDAAAIIRAFENNPLVTVVSASSELFNQALNLYESRSDKDWGLTDCASFVVMRKRNLFAALTVDEHFRQAGFRPLLLEQ
jgi:predicted nucleic acid-binding protein